MAFLESEEALLCIGDNDLDELVEPATLDDCITEREDFFPESCLVLLE